VRFLRHLAAATLTVAILVALGVTWAHAGGGGLPGRSRSGPGPATPVAAQHVTARQVAERQAAAHREDGFDLADSKDLERTVIVEGILAAVVVAVSSTRHRRRQARRRTLSSASP
jgi:hypothetical protein